MKIILIDKPYNILCMKKVIYLPLLFVLLALFISCDKVASKHEEIKLVTLTPQFQDKYEDMVSLSDEFTDFEIIPLENRSECLLSNVRKMIVTDSAMYFFDRGPIHQILSFSLDGKFKNRIGTRGHAKGEYQHIQNIASTYKGDTIAMMDFLNINLYNIDGKYLSSYPIKNENGPEDIFFTNNGFFLGFFHRQKEGILSFNDMYMGNKVYIVETPVNPTGYPLGIDNVQLIQQDGNQIICLDVLSSSFFVFDVNNPKKITKYTFGLDNQLTEDKARKDVEEEDMFSITSYQIYNGVIRGIVESQNKFYDFKFGLYDKTVKLMNHRDLNYSFDCCHSGYFYKILPAGAIIDFMDMKKKYMEPTRALLGKALSKLEGNISPTDNYYIIKMRLKK